MLKKLLALSMVVAFGFGLAACEQTPEGLTDVQKLDAAVADLSIPTEVSEDIDLPDSALHSITVTWESGNTDLIANDGTVTQPAFSDGNEDVLITATLTLGEVEYTKEFTVTVLATTELNDQEKLDAAVAGLTLPSAVGADMTLPSEGLHGVAITWTSSNEMYIMADGTVMQPAKEDGDMLVTLTATFAVGDLTFSKAFNVTVTASTEFSDEAKVAAAIQEILVPTTTSGNIMLLTEASNGATIEWFSYMVDYLANDGTVTNPLYTTGDVVVTLIARVSSGDYEETLNFFVTVTAATEMTDMELAEDALSVLLLTVSGNVETDFDLAELAKGYTITWTSSDETLLVVNGLVAEVIRPEAGEGNQEVVLTASVTVGDETATKDFTVTIKEKDPAIVYTTIADMHANSQLDDVIEFTGIVVGLFDGGYFLSDGTHSLGIYHTGSTIDAQIGDEVKVIGSYAVYNTLYQLGSIQYEEVLSTGNANPLDGTAVVKTVAEMLALDSSDALIHGMYYTVTGTVELRGSYDNVYLVDGDDAVLIYYYSLETSLAALELEVGKEVTITVFYYTDHGTNGPMLAFDGDAADITINTLPDPDALAADVAALESEVPSITVGSIVLPAVGANGTDFTGWASSNTAILLDDGTFVALGATSEVVTFTATATKGTETQVVTVEVMVPLNSTVAEVLAMSNDDLFQVTGVVYEMAYYGFYLEQGGDFIFVYYKQYDGPMVIGDEITVLGSRGEYNGLKQINLLSDITINSSGNALPTAVVATVEAAEADLVPRGSIVTVTGTVSIEGTYNDVFLNGVAGGKVKVYYRSNADELAGFDGQIITVNIVTYHDGVVLYQLLTADATVESAFTDAQKAQATADGIDLGDIDNVIEDLVLPVDNTATGATIAWATSDAGVVTDAGVITGTPGADTMATLTATVTVGVEVVTRDLVVTVLDPDGQPPMTVTEALAEADGSSVLVKGVIIGKYYDERVIQGADGAAIWVDSSVGGEIGDKIVVRGTLATYTSYGNNHRQLDSANLIETLSTGNALVESTETDVATIFGQLGSMEIYTATLTVKVVNDGYGNALFNTDVDDEQGFKMKISDFAPYFEDIYMVDDMIEITFTAFDFSYNNIRMVNVTMPALDDAQSVAAAKGSLDIPASATADLTLSTEMYGATIAWASDNAAIGTDGVVTRPAIGAGDATVTLTATITKGVETDTATFTVTVPEEAPPAATLFFSEYIEGGSNNKALEIYNPNAFDVVMNGYMVYLYSNGATDASQSLDLSGITIAAGDVYVIYNSSSVADISNVGDVTSSVTYFNGDDAIELVLDGTVVDVIGLVGEDPGSYWTAGSGTTQNYTIVRNSSVTTGVTVWDPTQWTDYAQDTFTYLGAHTVD